VTVVLFSVDRVTQRKIMAAASRRDVVARVLDAFDSSARAMARPVFVKAWVNPELEFTLLVPRLLVDLPKGDRVISAWLLRQVQLMRLAATNSDRVKIGANVGDRLLQWQHHEIKVKWFIDQLANDPVSPEFKVPLRVKVTQTVRDSWAYVQLLVVLAGVVLIARQVTSVGRQHDGQR
jgi:hypothetical protein